MLAILRDTGLGYILGLFSPTHDETLYVEPTSLIWPYQRHEAPNGRRGVPQNCIIVTDRSTPNRSSHPSGRNSQLSERDGDFVEKVEEGTTDNAVGWYGLDDPEVGPILGLKDVQPEL